MTNVEITVKILVYVNYHDNFCARSSYNLWDLVRLHQFQKPWFWARSKKSKKDCFVQGSARIIWRNLTTPKLTNKRILLCCAPPTRFSLCFLFLLLLVTIFGRSLGAGGIVGEQRRPGTKTRVQFKRTQESPWRGSNDAQYSDQDPEDRHQNIMYENTLAQRFLL